jgi:small subunit ribosomal protein S24e
MEIEIESKTDNPLFNRKEVHFIVHHENEKTPKRDLVRSELADKLKVKKEHIIVSNMNSSFGLNNTIGYAKIYTSSKEALKWEKKHLLKRNKVASEEKKAEKQEKSEESTKIEKKETENVTQPQETKPEEKTDTQPAAEKPEEKKE